MKFGGHFVHFSWKNRCVMLLDGNFQISARGDKNDFDYMAEDAGGAVAGNPGFPVKDIEYVDKDRIRLITSGGNFIVEGDDFHCKTDKPSRIYPEEE